MKNLKLLLVLFVVGTIAVVSFPFASGAVSALVYYAPFFGLLIYDQLFPSYYGSLSTEDKKTVDLEKWKSLLRSLKQVAGVLVTVGAFGIKIPFIDIVNNVLNHVLGQFDTMAAAVQLLIGFGLTLWGFFKNNERFNARLTTGKRLK